MNYVLCAYRPYTIKLYKKLSKKYNFYLIKNPNDLTYEFLKKINPKFVFFPDWSWIVPKKIVQDFKCVCFHESDLPKFRGGSPIQNQIVRGIKKTKTTAILMNDKLDAGDILMKKDLSLEGTIDDIFAKMEKNDHEMIKKIISGKYKKQKQRGKPSFFKRRTPKQSELKNLNQSKEYLYNFIRMLGDPYPNTYVKVGKRKIIFKSATLEGDKLSITGLIE